MSLKPLEGLTHETLILQAHTAEQNQEHLHLKTSAEAHTSQKVERSLTASQTASALLASPGSPTI